MTIYTIGEKIMELINNNYGIRRYKLKDIECNHSKIEVLIGNSLGKENVRIVWIAGEKDVVPSQIEFHFTKEEIEQLYKATLTD